MASTFCFCHQKIYDTRERLQAENQYLRQEIEVSHNFEEMIGQSEAMTKAKRLIEQVTGRVRWAESVKYMHKEGVGQIWEIGSGKVLTGLARRIERDMTGQSIGNPEDIGPALESLS